MPAAKRRTAFALVVDVGANMNETIVDNKSAFYFAKKCLISYIERKIFAESIDEVALILFGSIDTENSLYDATQPDYYKNITVKHELGAANWGLAQVAENLQPSWVTGDFVEAIIVAADHLRTASEGRRMVIDKMSIFVLSNLAGGTTCKDQVDAIINSVQNEEAGKIEIRFLGFDSDETPQPPPEGSQDEPGPSDGRGSQQRPGRKPKDASRLAAEAIARKMVERTGGDSYSFEQAYNTLSIMETRSVKPNAWKTPLEIAPNVTVPIQSYSMDHKPKVNSWKMKHIKDSATKQGTNNGASNTATSNGNSAPVAANSATQAGASNTATSSCVAPSNDVKAVKEYRLAEGEDEDKSVESQMLMSAYRYGSSLIMTAESMQDSMKVKDVKSMKVVAFCPAKRIGAHIYNGDSTSGASVILADTAVGGESSANRFAAFVHALIELNCVAIVRKVYNCISAPRLGCLVPQPGDETHHDALYYVEIPYTDEISMYMFASLPVGEVAASIPEKKEDRNEIQKKQAARCPDDNQLKSIDKLIDTAMLPVGDDDEPFKPEETRDPSIQHLYRVIRQRILHPDLNEPLPPASEVDTLFMPPQFSAEIDNSTARYNEMFQLLDRKWATAQEPSTNGDEAPQAAPVDITDLMGLRSFARDTQTNAANRPRATTISNETPLQDFIDLVRSSSMPFEEICEMLYQVVYYLLGVSLGTPEFERCRHCLEQMRRYCIERKRAGLYNDTLRNLFQRLASGCVQFFASLIQANAGLITAAECPHGEGVATDKEAQSFVDDVKSKGGDVSVEVQPLTSNANNASNKPPIAKPETLPTPEDARDLLADL